MDEGVRYAKSGDVHIAYQVLGEGPDVVYAPNYGADCSLDMWEDEPLVRRGVERLASFSRLILLDARGFGLSDRNAGLPTLEVSADDLIAVMDAAGSERAVLLGWSNASLYACLFAATHPERTSSLVLYGGYSATMWSADYPWGTKPEDRALEIEFITSYWGQGVDIEQLAPSMAGNERFRNWWTKRQRHLASPGTLKPFFDMIEHTDVRDVLGSIQVPTLVVHRTDDRVVPVDNARFMADQIADAKLVEVPGEDHFPFAGDWDAIADEVEEFITGGRRRRESDRALATVLFTDIADSTGKASEMGDRGWGQLLDEYESRVERHIDDAGGRTVKKLGDGLLATFDGPARAIRCAVALEQAAKDLGMELRAGIHTGEVELRGDDVGGIAVHIGARVASLADPGEVLVSSTVKDLVAGSGIEFADRGTHELKGISDQWRVFSVERC